ncbi:SusC/RagA family TonB-linked outer membrane protein [Persicobacter psychrovividus]|uniref:SusC/RagA family TonB-linked outer membrane protein n=1 Tax=Persicobacter psychrovividus TaxID=387638 RepID=A0ABN6L6Y8_9BACT|nr:SusC/RagA family TonB-linked outer membrane protein [Persicobacter psychrovividus]
MKINIKYFLTVGLFLLFSSLTTYAQQVQVAGKVIDTDGAPLLGATVQIEGTTNGTITDMEGKFSITYNKGPEKKLHISFIGYKDQSILIGNQANIEVILAADVQELSEVVVTALGVKRETKSLVYAQQGVDSESMKEARSQNFIQTLAGKAAGLQISASQTATGSNKVLIRGVSSLTGNNAPLYIVDGIPLENENQDKGVAVWTGMGTQNLDMGDPLAQINPDDIEDIQVLKGANASALYGSRAGNGVIIITTKKAKKRKKGDLGVTVNSNWMWQQVNQWPDYQYVYGSGMGGAVTLDRQWLDEETGLPMIAGSAQAYGGPLLGYEVIDVTGERGRYLADKNNVRDIYQTGLTAANSVSLETASDKGWLRFSFTDTQSKWMIKNQEELDRKNFTLRAHMKMSPKLSADATMLYTHENVKNRMFPNGSIKNPAFSYLQMLPNFGKHNLIPYKDEDGNQLRFRDVWFSNPYWNMNEHINEDRSNRILTNLSLYYRPIKGLTISAKANGDMFLRKGYEFTQYGSSFDPDGKYTHMSFDVYNWNFEGMAVYNKRWKDQFSLNATLGTNAYIYDNKSSRTVIDQLLMRDLASVSNNAGIARVTQGSSASVINSVFSSVSLGYRSTFFLDGTMRNDWSSTLPSHNNSFFYPSAGTSIVFSEFLSSRRIINFGKLRASIAQVGNGTRPFRVFDYHNYGGIYNDIPWTSNTPNRQNPNLLPEITTSLEYGVELKLLDRVNLNVTYYNSESKNQIVDVRLPGSTGYNTGTYNSGSLTNKGWEIYMGLDVVKTKNFSWSADINWSNNRTYVNDLGALDRFRLSNWLAVSSNAEAGMPYGVIRGRKQRIDPVTNTGLVYADTGLPVFDEDQIIGNAQRDWTGGVKNTFTYKGISLGVLVDVAWGGKVFSASRQRQGQYGVATYTLYGRDEHLFSSRILSESNEERRGEGLFGNPYEDDRSKGALYPGTKYEQFDPDGDGNGVWVATGKPNDVYIPSNTWAFQAINDNPRATFDASYVKLREITLGYDLPTKALGPFKAVRVSAVGRNVAILHQNTPKGIDPEAAAGLGIEFASFLPTASYGFNVKLSF